MHLAGVNEMDPSLYGTAVISHNEVSDIGHHLTARRTSPMQHELNTVAIDVAKKVLHLVGTDTTGTMLWRKRLSRHALMAFIAQLPSVCIGIEACGGAHYWARHFPRMKKSNTFICRSPQQLTVCVIRV
jgi:hypothetical protein